MRFKKIEAVIVILCILLTAFLPVYADQEKTSTEKADILNKLTIVLGDTKSYNLDVQLKRSEAAAFIVRLIGKEKYVMANKSTFAKTAFKDVGSTQWYAPYIGYCTQQGIICGVTKDTYKPDDNISEKAFLKITLGALGYVYNKDFNMSNVYSLALNTGLVTDQSYSSKTADNKNYKKEEVVKVLYNSLSVKNVVTGISVLKNLIDNGIITRASAVSVGLLKDEPVTAITQVTANSASSVTIKFNENIKALSASNIQIYETQNTSNKLTISSVTANSDNIVVNTSMQTADKTYTISISNIEDTVGNIVGNLTGSFTGYKTPEVNSNFFKIKKVEPISKSVIDVYFTQPINSNVEMPINYEILQGNTSFEQGSFDNMSIKTKGSVNNAVTIFLKNKTFTDGAQYTLKINGNITSQYGIRLNDGNGDSMNFTGKATENENFFVVSVEPLYNTNTLSYLKIVFNKEVDLSTAQIPSNYTITEDPTNNIRGISGSVVTGDGADKNRIVILTVVSPLDISKGYTLKIKNVQDKFKQITIPSDTKYPFPGTTTNIDPLAIVNASADDKGTLTLYFNRPLDVNTASTPANYVITSLGISPNKVYFNQDEPYMVRLFFSSHNLSAPGTYTIRANMGFRDYTGYIMPTNIEKSFTGSSLDYMKPFMTEATIVAKDAIRVRTSVEISTGNQNLQNSNYKLEYKDNNNSTVSKSPTSVSYINPTTLIIRFDSLDFSKAYTLRFLTGLTDYTDLFTRTPSDGMDSISVSYSN
jgi:S-layer homology domain.